MHGGFVEVSNNKVSILSDMAELAEEIDVEQVRRRSRRPRPGARQATRIGRGAPAQAD